MNRHSQSELTKLERLAVLMRDDGVEPERMDAAQIAQYLKERKIDMSGPLKRIAMVLKKAKARQSLEHARTRRLQAIAKVKAAVSSGLAVPHSVKEKVWGMIENIRKNNPDQAQVYAREFEKATPEDMAVLEQDLMLLEMEDSQDAKRDPQNPC